MNPRAKNHQPRPGEVWRKEFQMAEAERLGIKPHSVWARMDRGYYPHLKIRRVNKRVHFVTLP